jgi:hypothetical protein
VWFSANYSTSDWVELQADLVARYKHDPMVVGIDLRNEIHDTPTHNIGWGSYVCTLGAMLCGSHGKAIPVGIDSSLLPPKPPGAF